MTRRFEPDGVLGRPMTYADARARGISPSSLDSPAVRHPFWGVVAGPPSAAAETMTRDERAFFDFLTRCRDFAPRLGEHRFFSHGTALRLHGAPVPVLGRDELHVSAHRPAREPRAVGVEGHRLQMRSAAIRTVRGLNVEHPVRAWRQAGSEWTADELTAAGDFLIARRRPLASIADLRNELEEMGSTPALRQALQDVRVGSESSRETDLRLLLMRARLPEPELNVQLLDATGRRLARLDIYFRAFRVAVEYDGRQHAESAAQFARDADRWELVRDADIRLVRVLDHHMHNGGASAVALVRKALVAAGWVG